MFEKVCTQCAYENNMVCCTALTVFQEPKEDGDYIAAFQQVVMPIAYQVRLFLYLHMFQHIRFWYLSHQEADKAQTSPKFYFFSLIN